MYQSGEAFCRGGLCTTFNSLSKLLFFSVDFVLSVFQVFSVDFSISLCVMNFMCLLKFHGAVMLGVLFDQITFVNNGPSLVELGL